MADAALIATLGPPLDDYELWLRDTDFLLLPALRDESPEYEKRQVMTRREANLTGRCPVCGAVAEVVASFEDAGAARTKLSMFVHEVECSAGTDDVLQRLSELPE